MSESQFLLSRRKNVIGLAWAKYPLLVQSAMKSQPTKPCKINMATRKPHTWFTGLLMGSRIFMT